VSALEDPFPTGDWESFRAARDRFFAKVRPEAMDDPPASICPDALPEEWRRAGECEHDEGPAGA
jgi:hypothetical protein